MKKKEPATKFEFKSQVLTRNRGKISFENKWLVRET